MAGEVRKSQEAESSRSGPSDRPASKASRPSSNQSLSTLLDQFFPEQKEKSSTPKPSRRPGWDRPQSEASQVDPLDPQIRWLERQAALGLRTADIAHEIRNTLVSFKTFMRLLPEQLNNQEFMGGFREGVSTELARLERLLDAMLNHAQPSHPDPSATGGTETAPVIEAVSYLLRRTASLHEIQLETRAGGGGPVALSRDALQQVLLNLILNALEATPAGGRICLSCAPDSGPEWVELWLDDDGEGVSREDRERIFAAFESARHDRPGGLGLTISRKLVEQVGGEIRIGRSASGGTRVVVRLPAYRGERSE